MWPNFNTRPGKRSHNRTNGQNKQIHTEKNGACIVFFWSSYFYFTEFRFFFLCSSGCSMRLTYSMLKQLARFFAASSFIPFFSSFVTIPLLFTNSHIQFLLLQSIQSMPFMYFCTEVPLKCEKLYWK